MQIRKKSRQHNRTKKSGYIDIETDPTMGKKKKIIIAFIVLFAIWFIVEMLAEFHYQSQRIHEYELEQFKKEQQDLLIGGNSWCFDNGRGGCAELRTTEQQIVSQYEMGFISKETFDGWMDEREEQHIVEKDQQKLEDIEAEERYNNAVWYCRESFSMNNNDAHLCAMNIIKDNIETEEKLFISDDNKIFYAHREMEQYEQRRNAEQYCKEPGTSEKYQNVRECTTYISEVICELRQISEDERFDRMIKHCKDKEGVKNADEAVECMTYVFEEICGFTFIDDR